MCNWARVLVMWRVTGPPSANLRALICSRSGRCSVDDELAVREPCEDPVVAWTARAVHQATVGMAGEDVAAGGGGVEVAEVGRLDGDVDDPVLEAGEVAAELVDLVHRRLLAQEPDRGADQLRRQAEGVEVVLHVAATDPRGGASVDEGLPLLLEPSDQLLG
jgi:hypothetical protein